MTAGAFRFPARPWSGSTPISPGGRTWPTPRDGLPDDLTGRVGPEAMRHSFATLYLDAGGSLSDLQEVMGHADPRTTRRYDRERQARRQSPGDLVAAYLSTPPRQHL